MSNFMDTIVNAIYFIAALNGAREFFAILLYALYNKGKDKSQVVIRIENVNIIKITDDEETDN